MLLGDRTDYTIDSWVANSSSSDVHRVLRSSFEADDLQQHGWEDNRWSGPFHVCRVLSGRVFQQSLEEDLLDCTTSIKDSDDEDAILGNAVHKPVESYQ